MNIHHRRGGREGGWAALETVILAGGLVALICLVIASARIVSEGSVVDAAARSAARDASLARTAGQARERGAATARTVLADQGLRCSQVATSINTAGFATRIGQDGSVTATVHCTISLSDVALPGLPGSKTLTASFTSALDRWRPRQ